MYSANIEDGSKWFIEERRIYIIMKMNKSMHEVCTWDEWSEIQVTE